MVKDCRVGCGSERGVSEDCCERTLVLLEKAVWCCQYYEVLTVILFVVEPENRRYLWWTLCRLPNGERFQDGT